MDEEKSLKISEFICESFRLQPKDVRQIPALTLAYLGDCIYELVIRTILVEKGVSHVSDLNRRASALAKAPAQAELFFKIEEMLDWEELAVYKRGRNSKSASIAKSATVTEYRTATGFEALMGYLYLQGKEERIAELLKTGFEEIED